MAEKITLDIDLDAIRRVAETAGPGARPLSGTGPIANLIRLAQERVRLEANPPAEAGERLLRSQDLALRERLGQRRLESAIGREQESPFEHALRGLRLGFGGTGAGGALGLIGNVGQFASLLGRVNPVILGLTGGLGLLAGAAQLAASHLSSISQTSLATGGTPGQVAFGRALAGSVGLDAGSIGDIASQFRERLAKGDLASATFGFQIPKGFGPVNEIKVLLEGIERIRKAPTPQAAQVLADIAPELRPFLQLRDASDETIERIKRLAENMDGIANPEALKAAQEYNLALSTVTEGFKGLLSAVATPVVESLAGWTLLFQKLGDLFGFNAYAGTKGGAGKHESVQEQQLRELRTHTNELRLLREGTFGGGERARSAIPAGLRGFALRESLKIGANRLGAF